MTASTAPALPATGVWIVDAIHSTAQFAIRHHSISVYRATFGDLRGRFDAADSLLVGEIDLADLQIEMPVLLRHLLQPEFFDAERFPTIAYRSTALRAGTDATLEADGELTMKGVTRPVTARGDFTDPVLVRHPDGSEGRHFALNLQTTIDRREFGVSYNNELPGGIRNLGWEVQIDVAMELCDDYDPLGPEHRARV